MMYASAPERLLAAIGEPRSSIPPRSAHRPDLHESHDPHLSSLRRVLRMEETIERIVSFFRHASQGLEERKQILYLLGPVGGGKSRWPSG
jgi:serine protein kinase